MITHVVQARKDIAVYFRVKKSFSEFDDLEAAIPSIDHAERTEPQEESLDFDFDTFYEQGMKALGIDIQPTGPIPGEDAEGHPDLDIGKVKNNLSSGEVPQFEYDHWSTAETNSNANFKIFKREL